MTLASYAYRLSLTQKMKKEEEYPRCLVTIFCFLASLRENSSQYPKMYLERFHYSYYYPVKFDANSEN
jgi:hypothetical protein